MVEVGHRMFRSFRALSEAALSEAKKLGNVSLPIVTGFLVIFITKRPKKGNKSLPLVIGNRSLPEVTIKTRASLSSDCYPQYFSWLRLRLTSRQY